MKKLIPIMLFIPSYLAAQNVGIGTPAPQGLLHVDLQTSTTNGFLVTGTYDNAASMPNFGAGTRLSFYPGKAAFRAGIVLGTEWDNANTGLFSMATGIGTIASANASTALGQETVASGQFALANGYRSWATSFGSTVFGVNNRVYGAYGFGTGEYTIAKSQNEFVIGRYNDTLLSTSPNPFSWNGSNALFVAGNGTLANRHNAMVLFKNGSLLLKNPGAVELLIVGDLPAPPTSGPGTRMMWIPEASAFRVGTVADLAGTGPDEGKYWDKDSIGGWSFAAGTFTLAKGNTSTAFGYNSAALGAYSTSMGAETIAAPFISTAIGSRNDTLTYSSKTTWVATDPLFYIGNTNPALSTRSNAMVVYKNANIDLNGYTRLGKASEASPSIKIKRLQASSAVAQNTWRDVLHGLTASKILSVTLLLDAGPGFPVQVPPSYTYYAGYEYHYHISATNIVILNSATNSGNILNKAVEILITYEE